MAVNGRRKGKAGELEAAATLREMFGWSARRRQQFSGKSGDDDLMVDQTPSLFWEVKRVERLSIPKTMATAVEQAGRKCPVIMHRQNRSKVGWLITVRLEDLPRLVHAYENAAASTVASAALPDPDTSHSSHSQSHTTVPRHL
jgi:hypothetical protein